MKTLNGDERKDLIIENLRRENLDLKLRLVQGLGPLPLSEPVRRREFVNHALEHLELIHSEKFVEHKKVSGS